MGQVNTDIKAGIEEADASIELSTSCVPNISLPERRKRLVFGAIQLAIGLAILSALILADVDRVWRLPLFLVFAGAATGYFQAREKT